MILIEEFPWLAMLADPRQCVFHLLPKVERQQVTNGASHNLWAAEEMFARDGVKTVQVDPVFFKKKNFVWEKMKRVWSKELTEQRMPIFYPARLFNQDGMTSGISWHGGLRYAKHRINASHDCCAGARKFFVFFV